MSKKKVLDLSCVALREYRIIQSKPYFHTVNVVEVAWGTRGTEVIATITSCRIPVRGFLDDWLQASTFYNFNKHILRSIGQSTKLLDAKIRRVSKPDRESKRVPHFTNTHVEVAPAFLVSLAANRHHTSWSGDRCIRQTIISLDFTKLADLHSRYASAEGVDPYKEAIYFKARPSIRVRLTSTN